MLNARRKALPDHAHAQVVVGDDVPGQPEEAAEQREHADELGVRRKERRWDRGVAAGAGWAVMGLRSTTVRVRGSGGRGGPRGIVPCKAGVTNQSAESSGLYLSEEAPRRPVGVAARLAVV